MPARSWPDRRRTGTEHGCHKQMRDQAIDLGLEEVASVQRTVYLGLVTDADVVVVKVQVAVVGLRPARRSKLR